MEKYYFYFTGKRKFVDNEDHEFNASLTMDLIPDKFQKTLTHIVDLSKVIKYDIANRTVQTLR